MREIKFRAWDGEDMIYQNNLDELHVAELRMGVMCDTPTDGEQTKIIVMQYTGLTDKNGKEIYEGDIIGIHNTAPAEIVWNAKDACFICNWLSPETRRIRNESGMPQLPGNLSSVGNPWEVIGNIYENPELLKETNA